MTLASIMDTQLQQRRENERHKPQATAKPGSSWQHCLSKSKRPSEQFAPNLPHEFQRKREQLRKTNGSSRLLYGEEVVKEASERPECESLCGKSMDCDIPSFAERRKFFEEASKSRPSMPSRRKTPTESKAHPVRELQQTEPKKKLSLVESRSRQGSSITQGPGLSNSAYNSTPATGLHGKMKELPGISDEEDLSVKKTQLIESECRKLSVLQDAQNDLQRSISVNWALGAEVESLVQAVCRPKEVEKFHTVIGDLDMVAILLYLLSSRLVRVESALDSLSPEASKPERIALTEKREQLLGKLGEARELKEHIDRSEEVLRQVLARCLTPEQLQDYCHFVATKVALRVEQRQLEDKIRLGEEQVMYLRESLVYGHY